MTRGWGQAVTLNERWPLDQNGVGYHSGFLGFVLHAAGLSTPVFAETEAARSRVRQLPQLLGDKVWRFGGEFTLFVDTVGHLCPSRAMIASSTQGRGTVQIRYLRDCGYRRDLYGPPATVAQTAP